MELSFTKEHEEYRAKARDWLLTHLPEDWDTPAFNHPETEEELVKFRRNWDRTLYEGGYAGISWPKEYGGAGFDPCGGNYF